MKQTDAIKHMLLSISQKELPLKTFLLCTLAFVLIASYGVSVVSAQDYFDLNYGTDAVYTQFNYVTTSTDSCCGPVYPTYPFPSSWQATTDGSTAYTSIQAPHDYGGKVYANKGVQLTPQFGTYTWDQVKDWPIMITFDYYYDIQADPFHGSANAGITIPRLVDGVSPTNKPNPGVNCVVWSGNEIGNSGSQSGRNIQEFMKTSDGRLLTVDVLKEMSNTLQIAVQSQAASDPDESGLPSAYSRVIINNIKVNFDPLWNSPVASFTYSPTIVHVGENVHFDAYSSLPLNGIIKYTWDFKDETKVTTEPLTDYTFQDSGEHDVILTVELKNGKTATFTDTIDVKNQPPVAAFDATPLTGSAPLKVTFTDKSTGDGITSKVWEYKLNPDGAWATLPLDGTSSFTFTTAGTYDVKLTVTGTGGVTKDVTHTITVNNQPPVAVFNYRPKQPVPEQPLILDGSKSYDPEKGVLTYDWYFDDDATPQINHNPIIETTFYQCDPITVKLEVTDNEGLKGSTSTIITPDCSKCKVEVKAHGVDISANKFWHTFIVYTDPKGKEWYYRGGPLYTGIPIPGSWLGPIITEMGEFKKGTIDYVTPMKSITILKGSDAFGKDQCFENEMIRINSLNIPYTIHGPNSNTVTRTALHNCGCPEITPVTPVPGWNHPYINP